jgi:hypothetical protein
VSSSDVDFDCHLIVFISPGVHWVQDPRSRVYNFTPYIQKVPKVEDFAFERLEGFTRSSQDTDMQVLAKEVKKSYTGSTSSLSGFLSHIYFLIGSDMPVNTDELSAAYKDEVSDDINTCIRVTDSIIFRLAPLRQVNACQRQSS